MKITARDVKVSGSAHTSTNPQLAERHSWRLKPDHTYTQGGQKIYSGDKLHQCAKHHRVLQKRGDVTSQIVETFPDVDLEWSGQNTSSCTLHLDEILLNTPPP